MTTSRSYNQFLANPLYDVKTGFTRAAIGQKLDDRPNDLFVDICFSQFSISSTFKGRFINPAFKSPLGWPTTFTPLPDSLLGFCDPEHQRIVINEASPARLGKGLTASNMSHEYTHGWQVLQNVGAVVNGTPEDLIRSVRLVEGDAVAFQLSVAYEAMMNDDPQMWDAIIMHLRNDAQGEYSACINAFISSLERNIRTFFTGEAQNAVVLAWLENRWRLNEYETMCLNLYRAQINPGMADAKALGSQHAYGDDFKENLFRMPYARTDQSGNTTFHDRPRYGKFTRLEQNRLERITLPHTLAGCKRLNAYKPARIKPELW